MLLPASHIRFYLPLCCVWKSLLFIWIFSFVPPFCPFHLFRIYVGNWWLINVGLLLTHGLPAERIVRVSDTVWGLYVCLYLYENTHMHTYIHVHKYILCTCIYLSSYLGSDKELFVSKTVTTHHPHLYRLLIFTYVCVPTYMRFQLQYAGLTFTIAAQASGECTQLLLWWLMSFSSAVVVLLYNFVVCFSIFTIFATGW